MAYTHNDYNNMRQSLDDLKKLAAPLFNNLSAIEDYDAAITKAFTLLHIQQEAAPVKKSSKKGTVEDTLLHDLKRAHSFISLAIAHDTGPQFKQLLSDQLIMQRDMLDMLREVVEKRAAVTIPILELPEQEELGITEQDRKLILDQLNGKLSDKVHVDDATIVSQLNKFRTARESIMELYVAYLTAALSEPAALSKPAAQASRVPAQKKVHIFSDTSKESAAEDPKTAIDLIRDLLTDVVTGAREVKDMAEYLITKGPGIDAPRLQLELIKSDEIINNATLLTASDQLDHLVLLTNIIQLASELLQNYQRVVLEEKGATTGPRFSRHLDRASKAISQLPQSVKFLVNNVLADAKANNLYKAGAFAEVRRRLADLQQ